VGHHARELPPADSRAYLHGAATWHQPANCIPILLHSAAGNFSTSRVHDEEEGTLPAQAVAALSELAIPHFTTATIFSVAQGGSEAKFYANVKLLAVSALL
jgi:hypothetical protein